ncbi:MAG: hypothetical protein ACP5OA_05875 [Candidatus Woesearchaeota archaeon]
MPQKFTYWRHSDELQKDNVFDEIQPKKILFDIAPGMLTFTGPIDSKPEMIYHDRCHDEYFTVFKEKGGSHCMYVGKKDDMQLTDLLTFETKPSEEGINKRYVSELVFYRREPKAKKEKIVRQELRVKFDLMYLAEHIKSNKKTRLEQIL